VAIDVVAATAPEVTNAHDAAALPLPPTDEGAPAPLAGQAPQPNPDGGMPILPDEGAAPPNAPPPDAVPQPARRRGGRRRKTDEDAAACPGDRNAALLPRPT
jgi:hypothetical protein